MYMYMCRVISYAYVIIIVVLRTYTCRLISFSEFRTFESLLCTPDVISQLAFKLFDADNKGAISFGKMRGIGNEDILNTVLLMCSLSPSLPPSLPLSLSLSPLPFVPDNFKRVISATTLHRSIPFDFKTSFIKQYFGRDHTHSLDYFEFSQLLQVLPTVIKFIHYRVCLKNSTRLLIEKIRYQCKSLCYVKVPNG